MTVDPDAARDSARHILAERRFQPTRIPKPFEGLLRWLGDRLRPIGDLFDPLARFFSTTFGIIVMVAILVALFALVARIIALRRATTQLHRSPLGEHEEERDPARLETTAAAAEARGELELAVRLRFRAGLLRLDRAGAIRFRPSITSGQVARTLRLRRFDDLATSFDAIAYGGRAAHPADVDASRTGWRAVLSEASHS